MKKLLVLLLTLALVCGAFTACKLGSDSSGEPESEYNHDEVSRTIYDAQLGEYNTLYQAAKAEQNVSRKFALMAVAEAKLMESAVMLPLSSRGGNFAMSRIVPHTTPHVLWGSDQDRKAKTLVVAGDDFLKASEIEELREAWARITAEANPQQHYYEFAKNYVQETLKRTLSDTLSESYSSDPKTWDTLATSRQADAENIVHTFDGLMEYDVEGQLQPALAVAYPEISEDGKTYTFKIKEGIKWLDSTGKEFDDVQADDFVAGMQHMMDAGGGLDYLIDGIIENAHEYLAGEVTDFAQVGVKAVDKYTLQYKLVAPCSYFDTMWGYSIFAPMCRSFYVSKGGKFGSEYNAKAEDYQYGKTKDDIAYCGPFICVNHTKENSIDFDLNEKYWNANNVGVKHIKRTYTDGKDPLKGYNDAVAGTISGCGLNPQAYEKAKADQKQAYIYQSSTDATTFSCFFNLNRHAFANIADGKVVSNKSVEDKARTAAAIQNVHFRRAVNFALDRGAYNAQTVGDELALVSLRNCYTPGNFVSLHEEVTIKINGEDKIYPKGTYYGKIMQDQIDADGVKIKVWDPAGNSGAGSSDGFDGWYNADNAAAELEIAVQELGALGIVIDEDHPILLDLPCFDGSQQFRNRAYAFKDCLKNNLGGKVLISIMVCDTSSDWYNAGYFTETGDEANYDLYDVSGWGPDYGDPSTYLDTFLPDGAGYMSKCCGLF